VDLLRHVPIGIATALLAIRYVPESRAVGRKGGVDLPGAVAVTAGLVVLFYAIVKAEDFGWGSGRTLGLAAIGFALLAAFVVIQQRSKAPLIRLGIFRVRSLAGANTVLLLVVGGLFAFFFFSSLYVQQILGYSPLEAGLAFLPVTVGSQPGRRAASGRLIRPLCVQEILHGAGLCAGTTTAAESGGLRAGRAGEPERPMVAGANRRSRRRSALREPVSSPRRQSRRWPGSPHSSSPPRCSSARCSAAPPRPT